MEKLSCKCPHCGGELKKLSVIHNQGKSTGTIKYVEQVVEYKKNPDFLDPKPIKVVTGERTGKSESEFITAAAQKAAPPAGGSELSRWQNTWRCQNCGKDFVFGLPEKPPGKPQMDKPQTDKPQPTILNKKPDS